MIRKAKIRIPLGHRAPAVLAIALATTGAWASARLLAGAQRASTVALLVDTSQRGSEFPVGAVGLSMEAAELSTGNLAAKYHRLVWMMRQLGPAVLRIGGGSVEFTWWTASDEPRPAWAIATITPADLYFLRSLLRATGWQVILGVDLAHFEPTRAVQEASYASRILGKSLLGIEIGNEPDGYPLHHLRPPRYSPAEYIREIEAYRRALTVSIPGLATYGPATGETRWLIGIGTAVRMFTKITQHYYPINTCPATPPPQGPQPTAASVLLPGIREQESQFLDRLAMAKSVAGRPTRIGETNSVACNARIDDSPGFAGALWSLDWVLRAVSSGVEGLNFHDGPVACNNNLDSPICVPGKGGGGVGNVVAQPDYYGLLAARQLEGGVFVPTSLSGPSSLPDLTTWATMAPDGTVKIAIDNFAIAGMPQPVSISVSGYVAREETLRAPAFDANNDVTFGGAAVDKDGRLRARSVRLRGRRAVRVIIRPASAVIVTLRPTRARA
jgi:hypothetical protein